MVLFKYYINLSCIYEEKVVVPLSIVCIICLVLVLLLVCYLLYKSVNKKQRMINPNLATPWDKTYCEPSL